jgi:3-hydroxyisobutyrate dehydrogenase-like beta-hydroxyacid dehydrogenase
MFGSKIKDVGVIGLGIIGSRVAERLRHANFNVFVWNRTARAVPGFLASPHEVAEVAQVIQIFVRDAEALLEVVRDMAPALKKNHVVCAHSTVSVAAMKEAGAIVKATGAGFLDAPFTGSKVAALNGELVYYAGGDTKELDKVTKVLEASSKKILPFGPNIGDATVLKIATNLVSGAVVGALAEALAIAKAHGIEGAQLLDAFTNNANCSPLITMKLPAMMAASYDAHFSLKNMLKDAHYAQMLAREKALETPLLDASVAVMERAHLAGKGDLDYSVVFENLAAPEEPPRPSAAEKNRKSGKPKAPKDAGRVTLKAHPMEHAADDDARP